MPKINLYRNISVSFVIFAIMLVSAVFLLFYSKTTVIVSAQDQDVDLSFNIEVKESPESYEVEEKDVISGSLVSWDETDRGEFEVLNTKLIYPEVVGRVEIVNNSGKSQTLLKTTQLQSTDGVIVRTTRQVVVPAGGSVEVDVYPKEPDNFSNIEPGDLVIIKLSPSLQSRIYGRNSRLLTDAPTEAKSLANSDISRARDELALKILDRVKSEAGVDDETELTYEVLSLEADAKEGDEVDRFNINLTIRVKALDLDKDQLFNLISRKVDSLDLTGLEVNKINLDDIKYSVIEEDFGGNVLARVDYTLSAKIDETNAVLDAKNIIGKEVDEAKEFLEESPLIKSAEIYLAPYWRKSLPNKDSKIKVIVK